MTHTLFPQNPTKEAEFVRELQHLLEKYDVDKACNIPAPILVDHLRLTALVLNITFDTLEKQRAMRELQAREQPHRQPIDHVQDTLGYSLHPPSLVRARQELERQKVYGEKLSKSFDNLKDIIKMTNEKLADVQSQALRSERAVLCKNCDGSGFIVPIRATPPGTLQEWLEDSREPLEIDVTKLSDQEKAIILHAFDWSDNAPDTPLQRAGVKLMRESPMVTGANLTKADGQKGGEDGVH